MDKNNPKLSFHVNAFSNKVRIMNQGHNKSLTLSAEEARNLHLDIFALLSKIAELSDKPAEEEVIVVESDGGKF